MQKCKNTQSSARWACAGIHSINTNPCTLNTNTFDTLNHAHTRNDIPLLHTRTQFKCGVATTTSQSKLRNRTWICKHGWVIHNAFFLHIPIVFPYPGLQRCGGDAYLWHDAHVKYSKYHKLRFTYSCWFTPLICRHNIPCQYAHDTGQVCKLNSHALTYFYKYNSRMWCDLLQISSQHYAVCSQCKNVKIHRAARVGRVLGSTQ